jgi:hypothetical protein
VHCGSRIAWRYVTIERGGAVVVGRKLVEAGTRRPCTSMIWVHGAFRAYELPQFENRQGKINHTTED